MIVMLGRKFQGDAGYQDTLDCAAAVAKVRIWLPQCCSIPPAMSLDGVVLDLFIFIVDVA
jgi:hypothetical protein